MIVDGLARVRGIELETPFPRLTYDEADRRFGSDKPDLRFGLEIEDATEVTRGSEFGVFAGADAVRFLRVPGELPRGELAKLEEFAKEWGAKGLAYLVYGEDGEARSPIAKFLSEAELAAFRSEPGDDRALRRRRRRRWSSRVLGALRLTSRPRARADRRGDAGVALGHRLPDVRVGRGRAALRRRAPSLHRGRPPDGTTRFDDDPGDAMAHAYDLIGNGIELGGGSFRIHEPDLQATVVRAAESDARAAAREVRLPARRARDGRAAARRDRVRASTGSSMVLADEPNLRDVIAFPKNQAGIDPMSGAPTEVEPPQLKELGIEVTAKDEPPGQGTRGAE